MSKNTQNAYNDYLTKVTKVLDKTPNEQLVGAGAGVAALVFTSAGILASIGVAVIGGLAYKTYKAQ